MAVGWPCGYDNEMDNLERIVITSPSSLIASLWLRSLDNALPLHPTVRVSVLSFSRLLQANPQAKC